MKIYDGDQLIAIIRQFNEWKPGLDFVTPDETFIQVGTWSYDAGKTLDRHEHNVHERTANLTQECVFIVTGSMNVDFYGSNREFIQRVLLQQFDYAAIFGGGHAYEILEDNTRILETKNGPFLGANIDKTRY